MRKQPRLFVQSKNQFNKIQVSYYLKDFQREELILQLLEVL